MTCQDCPILTKAQEELDGRGSKHVDLVVGWMAIARELQCDDEKTARRWADQLGVPVVKLNNRIIFTTRRAIQAAVDARMTA